MGLTQNKVDFKQQRQNMVDGLLKTNGIVTPWVISGFLKTPREMFCLRNLKGVCYTDTNLPFCENRVMLSPLTVAQMLEISDLNPKSKVMIFACGAGYMASILATHVSEIHLIEKEEIQNKSFLVNAYPFIFHEMKPPMEDNAYSDFDAVFVDSGSIQSISSSMLNWLKPEGCFIALKQENDQTSGPIIRVSKNGPTRTYYDACAPLLPEMRRREDFIF